VRVDILVDEENTTPRSPSFSSIFYQAELENPEVYILRLLTADYNKRIFRKQELSKRMKIYKFWTLLKEKSLWKLMPHLETVRAFVKYKHLAN